MMNMQSRNQYLKEVRIEYLKSSKTNKTKLLDEAEKITKLERKCITKKLRVKSNLDRVETIKRKRKVIYDGNIKVALAVCWRIFDHPCGQRLKSLLETEVDRLRKNKELICSEIVADKLKIICPRTIDTKLKSIKENERLNNKYHKKNHPLIYQKIPVKVFDEQDRSAPGNAQVDLVEHCGQSAAGEYVNTLSTTDICTGWWEGEAVMGKGQKNTQEAIDLARKRYPFDWIEIHADNGTSFINWHLLNYCERDVLRFSRSRPYKKNDNCLVEQKNSTHVRRYVGHMRYDTYEEQYILNDLFRNELRLFKNFFQPVIKLIGKERIKGHIRRKYDKPKTPYHRIMESYQISKEVKQELTDIYKSLNPAELKREIDRKLKCLYKAYKQKQPNESKVDITKKISPVLVSFLIPKQESISVSS